MGNKVILFIFSYEQLKDSFMELEINFEKQKLEISQLRKEIEKMKIINEMNLKQENDKLSLYYKEEMERELNQINEKFDKSQKKFEKDNREKSELLEESNTIKFQLN